MYESRPLHLLEVHLALLRLPDAGATTPTTRAGGRSCDVRRGRSRTAYGLDRQRDTRRRRGVGRAGGRRLGGARCRPASAGGTAAIVCANGVTWHPRLPELPGAGALHGRGAALGHLPVGRRAARPAGARSSAPATPASTSPATRPGRPTRRSCRCGAATGSCPSTSSASRPTCSSPAAAMPPEGRRRPGRPERARRLPGRRPDPVRPAGAGPRACSSRTRS